MKNNLIVIDVETGDLSEKKGPITQVALEVVEPLHFTTIDSYDTFVKPYNNLTITAKSLAVSRVTMQQVNSGIDKNVLIKNLIEVFKRANKNGKPAGRPQLVMHNAPFDEKFLVEFFTYMGKDIYDFVDRQTWCTMRMCKLIEAGNIKSNENSKFNLTACCERYGIPIHNQHGAPADVAVTKLLLIKLINRMRNVNNSDSSTASSTHEKGSRVSKREGFYFEF